jgi:methyl-accepting chemotaxis protein
MKLFTTVSIKARLLGLIALVAGVFVLQTLSSLSTMHDQMIVDRTDKTQAVAETAYRLVAAEYERHRRGELSAEAAQQAALGLLRTMRYDDGQDYVWVNDLQQVMVMHPTNPDLEGKAMAGTRDPDGIALFAKFVEAAQSAEGASVSYRWPKPGFDEPAPKIAYVRGFQPWGWAIGTGIYVDDVEEVFNQVAWAKAAGGVLVLAFLIGFRLSHPAIDQPPDRADETGHDADRKW